MAFRNDKPCRDCGAETEGNALSCPPCRRDRLNAAYRKSNKRPSRKADARARMARQRAAARGQRSDHHAADFTGDTCGWCGAPAEALDHIIPLSRGGDDRVSNLDPICRPCNRSKGDKTPLEFLLAAETSCPQSSPSPDSKL